MLKLWGHVVTGLLSEGEHTRVYRGFSAAPSRPVLLKTTRLDEPHPGDLARLQHEYHVLSAISCRGVPSAYALMDLGRSKVLVHEDIGGALLDTLIKGQPVALGDFFWVASALVETLDALCRARVMHRQIEPRNILFNAATRRVHLLDFAAASLPGLDSPETAPPLTRPERPPMDVGADFHALGGTLYELLAGVGPPAAVEGVALAYARPPPTPADVVRDCPPALSGMVMRLLSNPSEDGYRSVAELKHDLGECERLWAGGDRRVGFELAAGHRSGVPSPSHGREDKPRGQVEGLESGVGTGPAVVAVELGERVAPRDGHALRAFGDLRVEPGEGHAAVAALVVENAALRAQVESHRHAIEDRIRAHDEELQRHRGALDAVLQHGPGVMFVKDRDGHYLCHSPDLAAHFGLPGESLVGRRDDELGDSVAALRAWEDDRRVIDHGEVLRIEETSQAADGPRTWLTHKFPVRDADGRVQALIGMSVDQTELRLARAEADQAARAKSEWVASVSREIRSPINAILGMSHLALRSELNPQQQNYIRKVSRSADTLSGLLDDMSDFVRIETGKLEIESVDFELDGVLQHVAGRVGAAAEEKGLELVYDIAAEVPRGLVGDSLRLGQVLVNLTHHAVRLTDRGEVVVSVRQVERHGDSAIFRFAVSDTGTGVSPEQQQRLFEPFSVADTSSARRIGDGGLGLAICHQLVGLMGATIGVESRPAGGTVCHFDVRLGLQPSVDALGRRTVSATWAEARLLVVDDNASARAIMVGMARGLGFEAHEVRDGWEALRALAVAVDVGSPFDLVLIDWKMAAMDGIECARQIALQLRAQAPAIVMMTACERGELLQQLQNRGIGGRVLTKPVTRAALRETCAFALGHAARLASRANGRSPLVSESRARLRGAHLLLVEDNLINQELAAELLAEAGVTVKVAANGQEALAVLALEAFDGVLMDCQMPVLDGYAATRAIRENPDWAELPVLAMTANTMSGDREFALSVGMNDHIAKPIDVDVMFDTLARWVRPGRMASVGEASRRRRSGGVVDWVTVLPGIDASVGRASTMGNDKLYRRLLGMFRTGQRDAVEQFRAAHVRGEAATATRLVHNLRTVSASLGAIDLARASRRLEVACMNGAEGTELMRLLDAVAVELGPIVLGLDKLDESQREAP